MRYDVHTEVVRGVACSVAAEVCMWSLQRLCHLGVSSVSCMRQQNKVYLCNLCAEGCAEMLCELQCILEILYREVGALLVLDMPPRASCAFCVI
jgi:hypothetical protein